MRKILVLACAFVALAVPSLAQTLSGLPAASQVGSTLTVTCPSGATASQIWRATGNSSTVTLTTLNWSQIGTVSTQNGNYFDGTGAVGTTYGYTAICLEGSTLFAPTSIYFGTPIPLVAGTLSGTTS